MSTQADKAVGADRLSRFFNGLREELRTSEKMLDLRLHAFFRGLAPAVDVARYAQAELDRCLATQWSIFPDFFHFIHQKENTLSRIFKSLLDPAGRHGQGHRFLDALLEETAMAGKWPRAQDDCTVHTEQAIADGGRVDIVVKWPRDEYQIGIENKPWAGEQRNQIKRYFDALVGEGGTEKTVLILYFSGDGTDPTTAEGAPYRTVSYRTGLTGPSVEGWLRRCRSVCEAERIRWFLAEIEDYIQRSFRTKTDMASEEDSDDNEHPT